MRLKTKLVAAATGLTFAIVVILSLLFVSELMRQRIEQTKTANDVLVHQVYLMMRQAMVEGLKANPPSDSLPEIWGGWSGSDPLGRTAAEMCPPSFCPTCFRE